MPTLNKERKNKDFCRRFPEKDPSTTRTIWKNVKKYEREGLSLNINKGRSDRRRTVRTEETIKAARLYAQNNARNFR